MNRLYTELERLYFLPGQTGCSRSAERSGETWRAAATMMPAMVEQMFDGRGEVALPLDGAEGARVLVVEFNCVDRTRDWSHIAALYQGLQDDLELPAPALAVRAHAGFALWISLAQPVALADAVGFLEALRSRYLAELPPRAVTLRPGAGTSLLPLLPARHAAGADWSAFIDPGLGALFIDEPWLNVAPSMNQQGDILAPLKSVEPAALARARDILAAGRAGEGDSGAGEAGGPGGVDNAFATMRAASSEAPRAAVRRQAATLALGGGFADPADFLLALMNDRSASARQRIAAAKALLPYYRTRKV